MSLASLMNDYDVFPSTGFLPSKVPLAELPQEYYKPWESIMKELPSLILTKRIRGVIDRIPLLSLSLLSTVEEYRRAYQVLCFLSHAYIWGASDPTNRIPKQVAVPFLEVSEKLGLPPVATYAATCIWNFREIIPSGQDNPAKWDLDNLTSINTFTGSIDETWFYMVSVFFEFKGAGAIKLGMEAIQNVMDNDTQSLINNLQSLAELVDYLGSVMMKMEEMCDPHIFYFRIRPFLAGWKNMQDVGLDKGGVYYGEDPTPRGYAGGSNAQSSLIQFLDILLGVVHHPTGERPAPHKNVQENSNAENSFMNEMRFYMPQKHREFLAKVEELSTIREYVLKHQKSSPELILSYDACIAMLKSFRDKHIQIVTRYVILQAKKSKKMGSSSTMRSGLAKQKAHGSEERGTGGTALLPFLKQCRDETGDPAAGKWGRRILSDGVMRLKYSKPNAINED
ncbi:Piso0_001614 [Millerozyma farinosa CBS 7064]|uniref:Indoleamine 2,3-dioxygenase n=1 Tax=Pichia sorbitophila (strain ATCC MYA-4447 / BCRC 22081 / CBS 7064 / NBRC 10061 / NRRL Y-12695) TaxID=559304 RepID=G8YNM4_PICSO|nr:Piso0_001614 [Millerozyma farinosa CBS 7064]